MGQRTRERRRKSYHSLVRGGAAQLDVPAAQAVVNQFIADSAIVHADADLLLATPFPQSAMQFDSLDQRFQVLDDEYWAQKNILVESQGYWFSQGNNRKVQSIIGMIRGPLGDAHEANVAKRAQVQQAKVDYLTGPSPIEEVQSELEAVKQQQAETEAKRQQEREEIEIRMSAEKAQKEEERSEAMRSWLEQIEFEEDPEELRLQELISREEGLKFELEEDLIDRERVPIRIDLGEAPVRRVISPEDAIIDQRSFREQLLRRRPKVEDAEPIAVISEGDNGENGVPSLSDSISSISPFNLIKQLGSLSVGGAAQYTPDEAQNQYQAFESKSALARGEVDTLLTSAPSMNDDSLWNALALQENELLSLGQEWTLLNGEFNQSRAYWQGLSWQAASEAASLSQPQRQEKLDLSSQYSADAAEIEAIRVGPLMATRDANMAAFNSISLLKKSFEVVPPPPPTGQNGDDRLEQLEKAEQELAAAKQSLQESKTSGAQDFEDWKAQKEQEQASEEQDLQSQYEAWLAAQMDVEAGRQEELDRLLAEKKAEVSELEKEVSFAERERSKKIIFTSPVQRATATRQEAIRQERIREQLMARDQPTAPAPTPEDAWEPEAPPAPKPADILKQFLPLPSGGEAVIDDDDDQPLIQSKRRPRFDGTGGYF